MKVLVLGCTGMLGSAVTRHLIDAGYKVSVTCRHESFGFATNWASGLRIVPSVMLFNPCTQDIRNWPIKEFDYVVNCIGVIKPAIKAAGIINTLKINSVFPHELAALCYARSVGCINITTDCVYSGAKGGYVETDRHDVDDLYGRSKSLGEETDLGMTIRTSIVGEEIHNNVSLIEWAKSQKGKPVNGFTNHLWNGITTTQYAKVVDRIMWEGWFKYGLFHVFSPSPVSKFEMLQMFNSKFNLGLQITGTPANPAVDRTLGTIKDLNRLVEVPEFDEQIAEM